MIRRIARGISKRWERKFRVEGYNAINGLAIAYQADLRKRMLAKLKKQFDDLQRGFALPDPNTTYINSFDEVPHMKFARDKLKELIAKVEKECGPLKLEISKERNPFDRTVDINEKGFRRLWEEINKDKDTLTKIMGPMAAILNNFGEFEEECLKKQTPHGVQQAGAHDRHVPHRHWPHHHASAPVPPVLASSLTRLASTIARWHGRSTVSR